MPLTTDQDLRSRRHRVSPHLDPWITPSTDPRPHLSSTPQHPPCHQMTARWVHSYTLLTKLLIPFFSFLNNWLLVHQDLRHWTMYSLLLDLLINLKITFNYII